jgi:alanine or glycine:cation symporter, AGCS family
MEAITQVLNEIDAAVWGPVTIVLLLGCHIYTTIRTKFIQRKLPLALKLSVTKDDGAEGDVSNFAAMATSLASTLGTGSIVGVATAVLSGGPGAVLWMWLTGILGMATKYTEVFAALKYRVKDKNGQMMGGAMHVWEQRHKRADGTVPWWAKLFAIWFAVLTCFTIFGIGSAVQTSAITSVAKANFGFEPWIVALIICGSAALIIAGGLKSISSICEKLVPFMGAAYILGCLYILVCNAGILGQTFAIIFESAFTGKAMFGGAVGSGIMVALQFGCARGLFSNEAGLGTQPLIASAAATKNPARQALVAMTGPFWCTVVICLVSGLVIVSTLVANPTLIGDAGVTSGAELANAVFGTIPYIGTPVLMLGILCFAYSTIIGWSYYGERVTLYLFGRRWTPVYLGFYIVMGFLGGIGVGDIAWTATDISNALMAIPNIIMVILCTGMVAKETKHYVYDGNIDETCEDEIPELEEKSVFLRKKA